jgi:hypothetical protein
MELSRWGASWHLLISELRSFHEELGYNIEGIYKDLYKEFDKKTQGAHLYIQVMERLIEGIQWKLKTQLAEAEGVEAVRTQ